MTARGPSERELLRAVPAAIEDPARASKLDDDEALVAVARRHRLTPLLSAAARGARSRSASRRFVAKTM